jgi:sarcosine oxidase subunit beta
VTEAADVIVVGGGIMGSSAAFFLRRRGRSVILLERGLVGQQASGTNFGNVRRQGRFLPQLPLAHRSRGIWGKLKELLGEDAEFLATGHVRICYREQQLALLETYARDARAYGLQLEILTQNALRDRFPFISPDAIAGSYSEQDGHANPRLTAPAFAYAARREGAQILENTEVLSVEKSGEDFRVMTAVGETFRAPVLLITAGAWGAELSTQFGELVPLIARAPQMAVTEPVPYFIQPVLGVSSAVAEEGIYMRQIQRGNVIFGGGNRGLAFADVRRAYVLPQNTLSQITQVRRVVPALKALSVIRVWSGIEGYLPDDIPIIGPSSKMSGLYYAFGFCGHGFQLGPGVGDTMAELIDKGTTTTPIEPFHIKRFAESGAGLQPAAARA